MVEQALYANTLPPLVMEMQTSQIFFVFAAPMKWWYWLAAPILMVLYKEDCYVCSTNTNQQIDD
jgi:hypothetical protein